MVSLVVSLIPEKSCWVSLPPRICNDLQNSPEITYPVVLKLSLLDARGERPSYGVNIILDMSLHACMMLHLWTSILNHHQLAL